MRLLSISGRASFFIDLRHQCHYGPYLGENGRQEGKTPHGHPGQPAPIDQLFPRRHRDNAVTAYVYAHVSRFCFRSMAHGAGYHDDLRATEKLGICLGVMQGGLTAGGIIGPLFGGILAQFLVCACRSTLPLSPCSSTFWSFSFHQGTSCCRNA